MAVLLRCPSETLLGRKRVRHQIAQDATIGERIKLNHAGSQFCDTGIFRVAVDQDRAFLANIRVEAAEPDREIGLVLLADADEAVQHGVALLERDIELFIATVAARGAAPDFQASRLHRLLLVGRGHACNSSKLDTSRFPSSRRCWFWSYSGR